MAYYVEGVKLFGVLVDFDLASYPAELVYKTLGSLQNSDSTGEATPDVDTAFNVVNNIGACQDRIGTMAFMAIETLDLTAPDYKHHLSHDLESIFYTSVWHGVGYRCGKKRYPIALLHTENDEKEVDLLRFWRTGTWKSVAAKKEAFLSSSSDTTRYILDDFLETICGDLARLFYRRRSAAKEAAEESKQLERIRNLYKKLMSGDGGNGIIKTSDISTWASRNGLSLPERSGAAVSKSLDSIYPEYAECWFLFDLDECEKSCCRTV